MSTAILGLQWGDEGKGKLTHLLAKDAEFVVRFNGGPNAGHTVIDRGVKFGTHLIPAGAFYRDTVSILASGMVIDMEVLRQEWEMLSEHLGWRPTLRIAENAHLIFPYHRMLEEIEGTGKHFGTTRRGIAPTYRDKAAKVGVRAGDLLHQDILERRLALRIEQLKRAWPEHEKVQSLRVQDLAAQQLAWAQPLLGMIGDATSLVAQALQDRRRVLFEGAQGTLLDVDHGNYPYVTSSSTTFAGLGNSIGIANPSVDVRLGVFKAYMTRVGAGPFPAELTGEMGDQMRQMGGEFGVTTGRPRRCGWLDLVALRHAVRVNEVSEFAITKLDVLSGFNELRVCRAYRLDGKEIDRFPLSSEILERCEPVYESFPGWEEAIDQVRDVHDLPTAVHGYIQSIEAAMGVPVRWISVGPEPEATIEVEL